jgi:SAM-dependent methyltransferase
MILEKCLGKVETFPQGLDVGCGTGQSSIALAHFCKKVTGIDPSREMLDQSLEHPKVTYSHYDKRHFNFLNDHFDLITFAGSLFYAKSQALLDEVVRVSKNHSKIIIYDFELLLVPILKKLDVKSIAEPQSSYDHEANFDGLNQEYITHEKSLKEQVSITINISNLAHLLLSSKDNYGLLANILGSEKLYDGLCQKLQSNFKAKSAVLGALTYSTEYVVLK